MHTLIRYIDFDDAAIRADVRQPLPVGYRRELGDFVDFCQQVGLTDISLGFRKHQSMQTVLMLMELRRQFDRLSINAVSSSDRGIPALSSPKCNNVVIGDYGEDKVAEHRIRLRDMNAAPDRVGQLVLLIGTSLAMDDDALSMLRLLLYELVVNTVEHARFTVKDREIGITLVTHPDRVDVMYRDNANEFSTIANKKIDINGKMKAGHKRGLGLFMLHRISDRVKYRRDLDWNETTFSISRSRETSEDYTRRQGMTKLSMDVSQIEGHDAVIIKTRGSINSNTAPALDAEFDDLMSQKKYTIVVDLKETDFISSSGIGVLLGTVTNLRDKGGDLVLMNVPKIVGDIFEILNIKTYFRVIDDLAELQVESR